MTFVHGIQDHDGGFEHEALAARDSFHAFDTDSQILIGNEQAGDAASREALLDSAFGRKERFAKTCQRIRDGRVPAHGLSLVARKDGAFIGTFAHVARRCGRGARASAWAARGSTPRIARKA